ncbi:MAG: phage terminase small subunit P27 family [Planctomycetota bacterium]|nr:phage terminase small subunit P27 family [Planctomycetota bacterium]
MTQRPRQNGPRLATFQQQPTGAAANWDPPKELSGRVAWRKWKETAALLLPRGLLTPLDRDALQVYAESWQRLSDCDRTLTDSGEYLTGPNGAMYPHPAMGERNKALERIRRFQRDFAMSPAARKGKDLDPAECVAPLPSRKRG